MKKTVKKIIMGLVASSIAVSCGGFSRSEEHTSELQSQR